MPTVVGQRCHILLPDPDQFILLAESGKPMDSPGFDHLGLLQDTRTEVDELLEACKRYRDKDDRVQIQEYEDLVYPAAYGSRLLREVPTTDLFRRPVDGAILIHPEVPHRGSAQRQDGNPLDPPSRPGTPCRASTGW